MPLPEDVQEELVRKRNAEHALAQRDAFWANVRTALGCVAWSLAGLVCMGFGLHTTDAELGKIFWNGGMVVGYAGILFTVLRAYAKKKERGDI